MENIAISLTGTDGSECHVVVPEDSHISAFIEAFKRILLFQGFHPDSIKEYMGE
jgi:hypothetical protein